MLRLVGLLAGCPAPVGESGGSVELGEIQVGVPEDDLDWWTLPNSSLQFLVGPDEDPTSGWEVLLCTSPDGDAWSAGSCEAVAHDVSSLGLYATDTVLAVTGVVDPNEVTNPFNSRALYALVTPDLVEWSVRAWYFGDEVDDRVDAAEGHDALVDPQFELGDRALDRVWFYAFPEGWSDPVHIPGEHDLCEGIFPSPERVRELDCPLSVEGAADPSPVRHPDGLLVASTVVDPFRAVVWEVGDGGARSVASFDGSVPFLSPWGDGLRMWYQTSEEPQRPVYVDSVDGGLTWTEPVLPFGADLTCTSNVAGWFRDRWVFLCARRQGADGA